MTDSSTNQPKNKGKNKKSNLVLILLLLFLIGFSAYSGYKAFIDSPKEIERVNDEKNFEIKRAEKLQAEILKAEEMLKNMGFENLDDLGVLKEEQEELRASVQVQMARIKDLKSKFEELLSLTDGQAKDVQAFKDLYLKLKSDVWQLRSQIRDLKSKNQELIAENEQLKNDKNNVEEALGAEKQKSEKLKTEKAKLASQIELGQKLQTYDLIAEGIKVRRNGNEKATPRARRVEKIRVAFTIAKNDLARSGSKNVYLRVIDPSSQTITDGGSSFDFEGRSLAYTSVDEIDYQNTKTDVVMYAKNFLKEDFDKGTYEIEIYCEESKIGETSVTLK